MYAVAELFTLKARKAAAEANYSKRAGVYSTRFTEEDCCPIGIMIRVDGYDLKATCPTTLAAACKLRKTDKATQEAIREFISDWDCDLIQDLCVALGVVYEA